MIFEDRGQSLREATFVESLFLGKCHPQSLKEYVGLLK